MAANFGTSPGGFNFGAPSTGFTFGAPSTGFNFGAPNTGFNFGTPSTGFGFPAPSTGFGFGHKGKKLNPLAGTDFRVYTMPFNFLINSFPLKTKLHEMKDEEHTAYTLFFKAITLEYSFGEEKDLQKAWELYNKAADLNFPLAHLRIYEAYCGDDVYLLNMDLEKALAHAIFAQVTSIIYFQTKDPMGLDKDIYNILRLKQLTPREVGKILESFLDGPICRHKEVIKIIFEYLYLEIFPEYQIPEAKMLIYDKMMSRLEEVVTNKGDELAMLALFVFPVLPIPHITDRRHEYALKHSKSHIHTLYKYAMDALNAALLTQQLNFCYRKIVELTGIEVVWHIRYCSGPEFDKTKKNKLCYDIIDNLNKLFHLIPSEVTKFVTRDLLSRCYEVGIHVEKDLNKAIGIMESTRKLPAFKPEDFPYCQAAKLYQKINYDETAAEYFKAFYFFSKEKKNFSIKFFRLGLYFEFYKKDYEKALKSYLLGLEKNPNLHTYQMEIYNIRCQRKIDKLLAKHPEKTKYFENLKKQLEEQKIKESKQDSKEVKKQEKDLEETKEQS